MHHFRRRVFYFLQQFIADAGVFFSQYNHLARQAVASRCHFDTVARYPVYVHCCLSAAGAKPGTYGYSVQYRSRKGRLRQAGRNRLLYQSESFYVAQAVEGGAFLQPCRAFATRCAQGN